MITELELEAFIGVKASEDAVTKAKRNYDNIPSI